MNRKLFEENSLGNMTLKNRVIRSAAGSGIASKDGFVTEHVKNWYDKVSKGGAGLFISEMMTVWTDPNFPTHYLRLDKDEYIGGLKELTDIVHSNNSKLIAQIGNYGSLLHWTPIEQPVGPSTVADGISSIVPRELSIEEIKGVINDFAKTALRAKRAGFDGVQVHAAHGFLLNKFINPYYNTRDDRYGGNLEGRSQILVDILEAIKAVCGLDFPVILKINLTDVSDELFAFTFEESRKVCRYLSKTGFDAMEVTSGLAGGLVSPARSIKNHLYNLDLASKVASDVDIPIILVGGIRSFEDAETALNASGIAYVGMTRAITRNPQIINQWQDGNYVRSQCTCCNKCFTTEGQMCIFR